MKSLLHPNCLSIYLPVFNSNTEHKKINNFEFSSQLFNQIDPGSGAPPADETTINNLPKVTIEQKDVG